MLRNLARVQSLFVTFSTNAGDETNKPGSTECYLPPNSLNNEETDTRIKFFATLGGKKLTTFPIGPHAAADICWRLKQATGSTVVSPVGITFEEFLNIDASSNKQSFVIGIDMEKVAHAGFTGEDTGGGRQLLLDFKRVGNAADHPHRCHVMLIHETAMSITESGVMVSM